jgi:hypothetical protein
VAGAVAAVVALLVVVPALVLILGGALSVAASQLFSERR